MSIADLDKLDGVGMGTGEQEGTLLLLITDHLEWEGGEAPLKEGEHLLLLQDKLNGYLGFIESRQYEEVYPGKEFDKFEIQVNFLYTPTENCKKYLDVAEKQVNAQGLPLTIRWETDNGVFPE